MTTPARFDLGPKARARGVRVLAFDEVESTNDEGRRLALEGERGPLWVVARRQTRGRGRLGRSWISSPGNLFASLILSGEFAASVAPQLGFVAGVAAIDALRRTAPASASFALKWPNDLLLGRAKLGGILLDGLSMPTGDARAPTQSVAVVGIGVNCADAPEALPYPTGALSALGAGAPSAPDVFCALSDAFVDALDLWDGGAGFAAIREKWLGFAAGIGESIRVLLAQGEELKGVFKTIDAGGRLVIESGQGARTIDAGDVFLAHDAPPLKEHMDSSL